jgi:tRNA (guanine37-N1)-methyltransferase
MDIDILSLFPEYFVGPFDESMLKRARERGLLNIQQTDIREFAEGKHRRVDDRPYGGGPGMVLMAEPTTKAIQSVRKEGSKVIFLSPQGKPLNAQRARALAAEKHLVLLCGHYEGIDQRVIDREVDEEISIGDYVLTNGCLAAIVLVDAVARFVPGVLGHEEAASTDSFEMGLLDCPHYTRPQAFDGQSVPEVLMGGDHKKIEQWRQERALETTARNRPDLYERAVLNERTKVMQGA